MSGEKKADKEDPNEKYKGRTVCKEDFELLDHMYGIYVDITTEGVPAGTISSLVQGVREKEWPLDDELRKKVGEAYETLSSLAGLILNKRSKYRIMLKEKTLEFRRKVSAAGELYDNIKLNNQDDKHDDGNDGLKDDSADPSQESP